MDKAVLADVLEELDALSDILTDLGVEREDPLFFGLSSKLDDVIEKYNQQLIGIDPVENPIDDGMDISYPDGC